MSGNKGGRFLHSYSRQIQKVQSPIINTIIETEIPATNPAMGEKIRIGV
jgi:hypothetical protein